MRDGGCFNLLFEGAEDFDDEFDFVFDEEDSDDDIPDFGRMGFNWKVSGLFFLLNGGYFVFNQRRIYV